MSKGSRFEVYLPIVHEPQEVAQVVRVSAQLGPQSATVLLAEDEAEVRELAALFLRSAGYTVLAARNGMEALEIAERSIGLIHVLVTDIVMPNMRGPELAKRLKALHPKLKVVYMSGYLEYNSGSGQFLDEGFFLQKPFARDTLVSKVMEALSAKSVVA